ncbi:MAG TPA: VOC family protein, partial [Candidatus Deferrimicrobium sp.]|nr:VOC family protein [Candidatus Deferrimicrobium sp.]
MAADQGTFDHLVLATLDLGATARWIERETGVAPSPGGQHVGRGSRNMLCSLGPARYLEIVGPDPEQADPPVPRPFGIDGLAQPALVAWAIAVPDVAAAISAARAAGHDPGDDASMERRRPDGVVLRWRLTPWRSAAVPFLIDWGDTPHPAATSAPGLALDGLAARYPDPPVLERILLALGGRLRV